MLRIFDNIELPLLPTLQEALDLSYRADFCIGYFNLRGWRQISHLIDKFAGGESACCRLLIGILIPPEDEMMSAYALLPNDERIDNRTADKLKKQILAAFRQQLTIGAPTDKDERGLRQLSVQLKSKKTIVKLFLPHPLHTKFYLVHSHNFNNPTVGFLGTSNLTLSRLTKHVEASVEVLEPDACQKLQKLFDDQWNDHWCVDISKELAELIDESWARAKPILPYHIYLKIAYHLSSEALAGVSEFRIPREFGERLFDFQKAAVQIAARHLNKRGGVLIGDVVGLGKTLVGTALARIFEDDYGTSTLIICPKNLVKMWNSYVKQYGLRAAVIPLSKIIQELPNTSPRFQLVLIDESHNLRNPEGKRYQAIQEYIAQSDGKCKCILLSATPYNKTYRDLSSQLKLFVPEDKHLGIRPEQLLNEIGELEFIRQHQCSMTTVAAFEKSTFADDWRDLMQLYMVRRTRRFIKDNYALQDETGHKYLKFPNGKRSPFPNRQPKILKFPISSPEIDPYARLYSEEVVQVITNLNLPRYGLGNYIKSDQRQMATPAEEQQMKGLSRAGKQLKGFCRTNLFKRLESSGTAFIQSIERHILRNYVYLYAIENKLDIPIGTQDAEMLNTRNDEDPDSIVSTLFDVETEDDNLEPDVEERLSPAEHSLPRRTVVGSDSSVQIQTAKNNYRRQASEVYQKYATQYQRRFKWIRSTLFNERLEQDLRTDIQALTNVLKKSGTWGANKDQKLAALMALLQQDHPTEKVLIFSQFADTVRYLATELNNRGVASVEAVTGSSKDPTGIAWRFSPESNEKRDQISPAQELRVLIATDVLSEGQNLQDCAIIVNYDLPWAIIRLIQRAGRVDRIGQKESIISCYSFIPTDGVELIINLRTRLHQRLRENAEVVGTDEVFFEAEQNQVILDSLYNEKSGILDSDEDTEVDLISEAYQIWKNATDADPSLKKTIENLPNLVYSTSTTTPPQSEGVLVLMKTAEDSHSLIWVDRNGNSITQSQATILRAAVREPDTPAFVRDEQHHELVLKGAQIIFEEGKNAGGQLGGVKGARFRTYERLKHYAQQVKGTLFDSVELQKAIEEIYRYPLRQSARNTLNRQLNIGISSQQLAERVVELHRENRLCLIHEETEKQQPQIICSLGLFESKGK